jgi:hypothetical protein
MARPLGRLLDPMLDALKITEASKRDSGLVIKVILRHMQKSRCSFWKWTESEWSRILHDTIADFETRNAVPARIDNTARNAKSAPFVDSAIFRYAHLTANEIELRYQK